MGGETKNPGKKTMKGRILGEEKMRVTASRKRKARLLEKRKLKSQKKGAEDKEREKVCKPYKRNLSP